MKQLVFNKSIDQIRKRSSHGPLCRLMSSTDVYLEVHYSVLEVIRRTTFSKKFLI